MLRRRPEHVNLRFQQLPGLITQRARVPAQACQLSNPFAFEASLIASRSRISACVGFGRRGFSGEKCIEFDETAVSKTMLRDRWDLARDKAAMAFPKLVMEIQAMYLRDMRKRATWPKTWRLRQSFYNTAASR